MFTFVNPLQPLNALYPMLVTLLGIVIDVIVGLPLKHSLYISFTDFPSKVEGIATSMSKPKYLIIKIEPLIFSTYRHSEVSTGRPETPQIVEIPSFQLYVQPLGFDSFSQ